MKKLYPFLLAFCCLTSVQAQAGYEISCHIRGLTSEWVYLGFYQGSQTLLQDSAKVENGKFVFEGEEALPGGLYLVVLPPTQVHFELMIDQDQHFELASDTADLVAHMEVAGSEQNYLFYNDLRFLAEQRKNSRLLQTRLEEVKQDTVAAGRIQQQLEQINSAVVTHRQQLIEQHGDLFIGQFFKSVQEPEVPQGMEDEATFWFYKRHYFDNLQLADERFLRTPVIHNKVMQYLDHFTYTNADSIIVAIDKIIELARPNAACFKYWVSTLFNKYVESKIIGMESVVVHMGETYYLSGQAEWIDEEYKNEIRKYLHTLEGTLIGDQGQDFSAKDTSDVLHSLFAQDAEWTILVFWKYDCGFCREAMDKLVEVFPPYAEKGVRLFTVNTNGTVGEWKKKMRDYVFTRDSHTGYCSSIGL